MYLGRNKHSYRTVYKCDKCKKILKDDKPIRLLIQKYGLADRTRFDNYKNIDLCKTCYNEFVKWYKGE